MKETVEKINELLRLLDQDMRIIEIQKYKQKLLENEEILLKIKKLQELDIYSNEYKNLKIELFQNSDFVAFKHYENELNLLIMQINQGLKQLTTEGSCESENY